MPAPCIPRRSVDGRRLRTLREARGITRQQLADAAGISLRTLAGAELGESQPFPVVVAALAVALEVEVESFSVPPAGSAAT
jgi:transcriptional regulator with XRE-family HTH domain